MTINKKYLVYTSILGIVDHGVRSDDFSSKIIIHFMVKQKKIAACVLILHGCKSLPFAIAFLFTALECCTLFI